MRKFVIFYAMLVLTVASFAQTTVEVLKKPIESRITKCTDTHFTSVDTGWVLTKEGDIIKTDDGGESFTDVTPPEGRFFRKLFFVNDSTGWVVCRRSGGIYKTSNGGETWLTQTSDSTSVRLYSVYALSNETAFVGGQSGAILKTTDGGTVWVNQETNVTTNIFDIYAFDNENMLSLNAAVSEDDPTALVSFNGGTDWETKHLPRPTNINPCYVYDIDGDENGTAYICGSGGTIFKTTNFGEDWEVVAILDSTDGNFSFINTTDGTHVWTGASNGKLYYSENGGTDWTMLKAASSEDLNNIHVFDDSFILETDDQWYQSDDNGQSYSSYSKWTTCNFGSIASFGDKIMAITTESANITISNDGGDTWSDVSHITNAKSGYLHDVLVSSMDTALYVGNYGQIGYTIDGGQTWTISDDSSDYNLFSIGKNNVGDDGGPMLLTAGEHGIFFYSTDVTQGWNADNVGFDKTIYDMYGNDEQGYAIFACGGSILKSPYDGAFSEVYHDSNNTAFNAVDFIDDSLGFVVGNSGLIAKTTDAGDSWTVVDTLMETYKSSGPRALSLFDIHFIDSNNGYICASNATLLKTSDAGDTWTTVAVPEELSRNAFYKMTWISNTEGFIAASGGYLLKISVTPATKIGDNSTKSASQFRLQQNYPNPFNPTTTISYSLAKTVPVAISIYNTMGQKVATLINKKQDAGNYSVTFNGENLASGLYFYKISAGDFVSIKKMLLIK